jgi:AAA domain
MSLKIPRPVDPSLHPLVTGNYRLATPAIEGFYELVTRCLRYRIMGALIYGPSRVGKTRAIEYARLLLAREYPKITTYHAQCEHKPRHAEGPFFATLLEAVGDTCPNAGTTSTKRTRLSLRIREAAARAGSGTVILFCDEAQRLNDHEYEWLRDVHDALDRQQIKLFTFLVGQEELLAQKTALQVAHKTQIVARLMVEELAFSGIRNAEDVATCLNGYDQTAYPERTPWSFTRFYVPQSFDAGYRPDQRRRRSVAGVRGRTPQGELAGDPGLANGIIRTRCRDRAQGQRAQGRTRLLPRRSFVDSLGTSLRLCSVSACHRTRACDGVTRRRLSRLASRFWRLTSANSVWRSGASSISNG